MAGITYLISFLSIISLGIVYVIFRRIWNIAADAEIFGWKLPKI